MPHPLPGGIASFAWSKNRGRIRGEQLYATGVSNLMRDILTTDSATGIRNIHVGEIGIHLYSHLKLTQNYYKMTGYSGLVVGAISLTGGIGVNVTPLNSNRHIFFPDDGKVRLSSYNWSFEIDTITLYDDAMLNLRFATLIRDISWSLGIPDVPDAIIQDLLISCGWLASPTS
jgi:hypothetical protein